jgi:hypothetical protein
MELPSPKPEEANIVKSIQFNRLKLDFTKDTAWGPTISSEDVSAVFALPPNVRFPVAVTHLELNISVSDGDKQFADLFIPKVATTSTGKSDKCIRFAFSGASFTAHKGCDTFRRFLESTITSETRQVTLSGKADVVISTPIGPLSLKSIKFSVETSIKGLKSLKVEPTPVKLPDVSDGSQRTIKVSASLHNPRCDYLRSIQNILIPDVSELVTSH